MGWADRIYKNQPAVRINPRLRASVMRTMLTQPEFGFDGDKAEVCDNERHIYDSLGACPSAYLLAVSRTGQLDSVDPWNTTDVYNPPNEADRALQKAEQELTDMVFVPGTKATGKLCPRCRQPMITVPRQLRGGDEGMSGVMICAKKDCR